jgi:transcription elongation factor Elf1
MSDVTNTIIKHLRSTVGEPLTCPMCHKSEVGITDGLHALVSIAPDNTGLVLNSGIPVATAICTHCGYVMLFSAQTLGL